MTYSILQKKSALIKIIVTLIILLNNSSIKGQIVANFSYTSGANGLVNFISTATNTTGSSHLYWDFGDSSPLVNGSSVNHTYTINGVYNAVLHIQDLQDSTSNSHYTFSQTILVNNVYCSPTLNYTLKKDSLNPLAWIAIPNYPANTIGATWTWGDGTSSFGLFPSHSYSVAGWYNTCVTVTLSCGTVTPTYCDSNYLYKPQMGESNSMTSIRVENVDGSTVGVIKNSTDILANLVLFPNPASESVTLKYNSNVQSEIEMKIINIAGQVVLINKLYIVQGENHFKFSVNELPAGIYSALIKTGSVDSKILRLIKN